MYIQNEPHTSKKSATKLETNRKLTKLTKSYVLTNKLNTTVLNVCSCGSYM